MAEYLVIITTVLVVTQIIRVTQNAITLRRQTRMMKKRLDAIEDVTNEDLRMQKKAYSLIVEYLEHRVAEKREVSDG